MARAVSILAATGCFGLLLTIGDAQGEDYHYGTGFFVHPDGFLLTNEHIVEGAKEIAVVTSDGRSLPARVIRADAYKDLALIKVEVVNSPYLALGRSADVKVLDSIIAVGFPYAEKIGAELSAYDGKVNAIRESGRIPILQIDANVNPGNSGGPVLNDRGEVVGVVVGKVDAAASLLKEGDLPERINFAIPIDECKGVISAAFPFGYPQQLAGEKLEPGAIFGVAKPAIALVFAEVLQDPKSQQEATRLLRASPAEDNLSREDAVRLNLSAFVEAFINAGGSHSNPLAELPFYADNVDYFQHGVVDREFIMQDIQKYVRRWTSRRYWVDGEIRIEIVDKQQEVAKATFRLQFATQNAKKTVTGICDDVLLISHAASRPNIIVIKSKLVSRSEKPTAR